MGPAKRLGFPKDRRSIKKILAAARLNKVSIGITLFAVAIIAGLWFSVESVIGSERDARITQVKLANANLARTLEEHTARTLGYVDGNLLLLKRQFEAEGRSLDLEKFAATLRFDRKIIRNVTITDDKGTIVLSLTSVRSTSLADREDINVHFASDTDTPFIGKPTLGRTSGKWSIDVTRRANKPDGSLLGVVGIAVDPFYFTDFFKDIDLGLHGSLSIGGLDGIQRVRLQSRELSLGITVANGEAFRNVQKAPSGSFIATAVADGMTRIYSYRAMKDYPLYVLVATSFDEDLARVERRADIYRLSVLAASFAILMFAGMLIVFGRRERKYSGLQTAMSQIMDASVDGIVLIDQSGKILSFSSGAKRIFQYRPDEVLGKNISMLMPEPYRSGHDGYLSRYLSTGEAKIIGLGRQVRGLRKDGSEFPMDLAVGELPSENGIRKFIGTVRDITARLQYEAQIRDLQKREAVGQLTGGVAHDFNNLLMVIGGNLEFIEEGLDSHPQLRGFAETMRRSIERGATLTRSLLAFARQQTLQPAIVDVRVMLREIETLIQRTLPESIDFKVVAADDLWFCEIDPGQLQNALLNLITNARDAMRDGGQLIVELRNIEVDAQNRPIQDGMPTGSYVEILVSDTGHGMTGDVIAKAFDPFFTTKDVGKGSGLGLSMVYGFVTQSKGFVKIDSEVGLGTTIRIYLPRAIPLNEAAQLRGHGGPSAIHVDPSESEPVSNPIAGKTVLVVEDDADVRALTVSMLRSAGLTVLEADRAEHALKIARTPPQIDLLLSDVILPDGKSGRYIAEALKRQKPGLKVLYMSGYTEDIFSDHLKNAGEIHLLQKPFKKDDLLSKVEALLTTEPALP